MGYQASRAGLFALKHSDADDWFEVKYPIRGLKSREDGEEEWEVSSLSWQEVQELKTDFLLTAFSLFSDYNVFKILPHGKGTMDERETVIEAIKILKEEENLWDAWESERNRNK